MRFFLSVYEDRGELRDKATRVWKSFGEADMHPRGRQSPDIVGATQHRVGAYAGVLLSARAVNLVLATELLEKATECDQRLTLLHECIHMDFGLGEHNERWLTLHKRAEETGSAITGTTTTAEKEADRQRYLLNRNDMGFGFLRLPDEIVAEQCLKHKFGKWFEKRAKYYVRMRQAHEADVAAPKSDVPLRPFHVLHELLRCALYIPLVADVPGLEAEHAELMRLKKNAEDRLREYASAESILAMKPRLLDVSFDKPLREAEAAYEEMYARITATEPDTPSRDDGQDA